MRKARGESPPKCVQFSFVIDSSAFCRDFEISDIDRDISGIPLMRDFKSGSGVRRARVIVADSVSCAVGRDGAASNGDADVAGCLRRGVRFLWVAGPIACISHHAAR